MGWLRDLMHPAGVVSFGRLARSALAHSSWPSESRVQQRSLATMLSRFDRGAELEWLADRPVIQQILAEVLSCTVADIRAPLVRPAAVLQSPRRLRLEALPQAQALDLCEEELPPGIAPVLCMPGAWKRLVWPRRAGDGATLIGHWLDARGRAEVRRVSSVEELRSLATVGPPLLVELPIQLSGPPQDWEPQRAVCLTFVQAESTLMPWTQSGWDVVQSPPIADCVPAIVSWAVQRIGGPARFDIDAASRWILESLVATGVAESLGDVIGWCGYLAEFGLDNTRRRTSKQLLSSSLKRLLAPLAKVRDATTASWSRKLPDLLVAMAEHSLLTPSMDLLAPRPLEAWVELFPEQDRVGPDLDWMKTHLSAASKVIRASDLEKAAAQFPPGAHRWLGLLRDAGLLQPAGDRDYALRPHHIARLCRQVANDGLIQGSSAVWGAALFHARSRRAVWRQVVRQADITPESLIDAVLEDLDEESAGSVLALEATVVAVGMSVLTGREPASCTIEQMLDEACALALQSPGQAPCPRIGLGRIDGVDANLLWWLALIALSETAGRSRSARPASLDPWNQKSPPGELHILLDALLAQWTALPAPRPPWVLGAFLVLDRLRQTIGAVLDPAGKPHQVFSPGIVLDEIQHGVLEWASFAPLVENGVLYDAFVAMAEHRRVGWASCAESFWRALEQSQVRPDVQAFLRQHLQALAPHIPQSLGLAWLDRVQTVPCEDLLAVVPESIVLTWLDHREIEHAPVPPTVVQHASGELLERMLAELDGCDEELLPIFWQRVPNRVVARLQRFRVMLPAKAARWIDLGPVSQSAAIFKAAALDEWLKASEPLLLALRRFCVRCIDERSENWQLAYNWLVRIERVLRT